jgi:hypothetical protein
MSNLKVNSRIEKDNIYLGFTGAIDESFEYANLINPSAKVYNIDFNELKMINSTGIREWIRFIEKLGSNVQFNYFNCPHYVIQQMNMVKGFLSSNAKVLSFYAPYYCEEADQEKQVLLDAKQIVNFKAPVIKMMVDGEEVEMEFDGIEEQFFKFLKK